MLMNWNQVQLLIRDKVTTTSGLAETIFRIINTTIGVTIVKKMIRIWNRAEMSITDGVKTTSGFSLIEVGEVKKMLIGVGKVKKMLRNWVFQNVDGLEPPC